jgi:hypothetical protein
MLREIKKEFDNAIKYTHKIDKIEKQDIDR